MKPPPPSPINQFTPYSNMVSPPSDALLTKLASIIELIANQSVHTGAGPNSKVALLKEVSLHPHFHMFSLSTECTKCRYLDQRIQRHVVSLEELRVIIGGWQPHHCRTRRHHRDVRGYQTSEEVSLVSARRLICSDPLFKKCSPSRNARD